MSTIESYGTSGSAPKGSGTNPYTLEEFESKWNSNTWTGGYVIGIGLVGPNPIVISSFLGSGFISNFLDFLLESLSDSNEKDNNPSGGSGGGGNGGSNGGSGGGGNGGSNGGSGHGGTSGSSAGKDFPIPDTTPVGCPAAAMAGFAYHDKLKDFYEARIGVWMVDPDEKSRFESEGIDFEIPLIGFKAELFVRKDNFHNIIGYVVSFAGTDSFKDSLIDFFVDAENDVINLTDNPSPQYIMLYNFIKKIDEIVGDKELTFVGHSLGGGLASLASILTGRIAIVFNPAAVANSYITALGLVGESHGTSNIYGYLMEWDYVTIGQAFFQVFPQGNFKMVENKTGGDPHAIETMVKNLE